MRARRLSEKHRFSDISVTARRKLFFENKMTNSRFEGPVWMKAPQDIPKVFVQRAIDHHLEIGKSSRGDVADAIKLARSFADIAAMPDEDEDRRVSPLAMTRLETVVTSELLMEQLKPEVENLRDKLFSGTEPPFLDYDDAVNWIEQEAQKGKPDHAGEEGGRLYEVYRKELCDFTERWRCRLQVPREPSTSKTRH